MPFKSPVGDLYISHNGGGLSGGIAGVKWFVVEPGPKGLEAEIESLLSAGRTVYHIKAKPRLTERLLLKRPVLLKPAHIDKRRKVKA